MVCSFPDASCLAGADFSALLDGGYDRSKSMLLGAQMNLPAFNSSTSRSVWTSGNDTGPWSYFGPWEKTIGAAFFSWGAGVPVGAEPVDGGQLGDPGPLRGLRQGRHRHGAAPGPAAELTREKVGCGRCCLCCAPMQCCEMRISNFSEFRSAGGAGPWRPAGVGGQALLLRALLR